MTLRYADKLVFGLLFFAAFLLLISLLLFNHGESLAFYILAPTMIVSAVGVVTIREIIRSGFLLALCFLCLGGLYIVLNASFLGAAQILIYTGAVAILFVFGIMLTHQGGADTPEHDTEFKWLSLIFIFVGLFLLLARGVWFGTWKLAENAASADTDSIVIIGQQFFSTYLLPFEIASLILLMALMGAILIARKDKELLHE